jgi:hypothetical protein
MECSRHEIVKKIAHFGVKQQSLALLKLKNKNNKT